MFCNQCGTYNPDQAMFCGNCGSNLQKQSAAPTVDVASNPMTPLPATPVSGEQYPVGNPPGGQGTPEVRDGLTVQGSPPVQFSNPTGYGMQGSAPPSPPPDQAWGPYTAGTPPSPYGQMPPPPGVYMPGSAGQVSPSGDTYPVPPQGPVSQPGVFSYPSASTAPVTPAGPEPGYRMRAKPLPLWAFIGSIVLVAAILVVLQITGSDWAAGAMHLAVGALIIAGVIALAAIVRSAVGMAAKTNPKRVRQFTSAGLAILILPVLGLVGFTQQSTIHGLQAHSLEGQQQWQTAINEYRLAGESAPISDNIARVYAEWGEQFSAQQHFDQAVAKFDTVLSDYALAKPEVARAQADKIKAYLDWAAQASQQHDYATATTRYDAVLQLPYCDSNCQSQTSALDATAYYNLAESQLAAKQYDTAVTTFQTVLTRFPNSGEAQKLHGDLAKALFGQGQGQLSTACSSAIPTYQQLASQFGDTAEGQQAAAALKAPQPVKGHFTGSIPNNPALTRIAALVKGLYHGIPAGQFFNMLNSAPQAIIQNDGSFSFRSLPQGTYDLTWGTNNTDGSQSFNFVTHPSDSSPVYVATVGPLCAYDFGDIPENIPVAP